MKKIFVVLLLIIGITIPVMAQTTHTKDVIVKIPNPIAVENPVYHLEVWNTSSIEITLPADVKAAGGYLIAIDRDGTTGYATVVYVSSDRNSSTTVPEGTTLIAELISFYPAEFYYSLSGPIYSQHITRESFLDPIKDIYRNW
jgi:hypothetical protein